MKAAVYRGASEIKCEEWPRPEIKAGEILLKVKACGLCGTDISKIVNGTAKIPSILGHEVAGEVREVGPGVQKFKPGERVLVAHHVACSQCFYCQHGNYSLCPQFRSTNIDPGGFAEYIRVPALNLKYTTFLIPDNLSYEEAALSESAACSLKALERIIFRPGDSFLVIGAGPMGLLNLQLALLKGAGQVIALDLVEERLAMARKLGAAAALNSREESTAEAVKSLTEGRGADVAIVSAGNVSAISEALSLVRSGGTVVVFAECPPDSSLSLNPNLIYHELSLIGSYSSTPWGQEEALELIKSGKLKVKELITHHFPLEKLSEAVALARNPAGALKIMINP